ncbi:hypothetical protein RHGRI_011864 [Rhododendron griersonianum]|uniref:Pectinesterase catalytic domain-containing protein n=1 Tax=Rhododendron griersonianum TaxID=479676 RepID=A0AAV6KNX7_9ERIC|nr:hypothetical protein RHGRI_011864 [Rhododendron griersonianum]
MASQLVTNLLLLVISLDGTIPVVGGEATTTAGSTTFLGDGWGRTIITADGICSDLYCSTSSATLRVYGTGLMASHLTLENTTVVADKYAVAVDSSSSFSVFYRCEFKAQKGALLARGYCQLYRECKIQGASDLVFGNAHTILQRVTLIVSERDAIYSNASLYWGVPLGPFAKIVIMQSLLEVRGTWSYTPYTPSIVFYGQYDNSGSGAVDAHAKDSAKASIDTIQMAYPKAKLVLVVAMASDKDHSGFARELLSVQIYFTLHHFPNNALMLLLKTIPSISEVMFSEVSLILLPAAVLLGHSEN